MTGSLAELVARYARTRNIDLPPQAMDSANVAGLPADASGLAELAGRLGWPAPVPVRQRPRTDDFPLMLFDPQAGWFLADQWDSDDTMRGKGSDGGTSLVWSPFQQAWRPQIPDPLGDARTPTALGVFWRAILRRRGVLFAAILATVIANLVALATSLYSMQVYDRVIPRSSFATLWVLTIGVTVALFIDFALRTTRALMIEREAAHIDAEVSEFFFARAQAVRLDARPPGVGTMAAQLRGLEQVRSILSSASLFLIADLPFALFFILVIVALGGIIAIVPLITFPVALGLGFLFARLIRSDTDKAQISGNRKNGLLVEALDAAEIIKANRGGWHMLGRWNRLIASIHEHEDPVKRWSSVAGSIFSTLQQLAYVLMIALGAYEVAGGRMTTGSLIAAAIVAGRVNGPLVAQLPSLVVQWGYARSSLRMLDGILALPLDRHPELVALRPERLSGRLKLEDVRFGYSGARETLNVPSLSIEEGERVAIIGGIGSGKTTLLRVIAGLYRPGTGRVTLAGLDLLHVAEEVVRRHIGYLPQDVRLVNGTLRENLLLGLSHPGDDRLMTAAERTGLMPVVRAHPAGFDLPIAEGGTGLSGGQRALTGLTRLVLGDPSMWLLDEPTANLDPASEARVLSLLDSRMRQGGTLVMVTHRLQLLSLVSRVIVMSGGSIQMDGPTQQVIDRLRAQGQQHDGTGGAPNGVARPAPLSGVA